MSNVDECAFCERPFDPFDEVDVIDSGHGVVHIHADACE